MNPNPRSDTIFFTVPFGIARSPPLEHRIERIGPVRERRMPAARQITRRPRERLSCSIPPGMGEAGYWAMEPQRLSFALRGVKFLDNLNPARLRAAGRAGAAVRHRQRRSVG